MLAINLNMLTIRAAIVVGKYLYIDGGEIVFWNGSGKGYDSRLNFAAPDGVVALPGSRSSVHIAIAASHRLMITRQPNIFYRSVVIVDEQHCYSPSNL